jgi:hypothetical protein
MGRVLGQSVAISRIRAEAARHAALDIGRQFDRPPPAIAKQTDRSFQAVAEVPAPAAPVLRVEVRRRQTSSVPALKRIWFIQVKHQPAETSARVELEVGAFEGIGTRERPSVSACVAGSQRLRQVLGPYGPDGQAIAHGHLANEKQAPARGAWL